MQTLLSPAAAVALLLRTRGEKLAIAESSSGGLISAALLAQPGASAYFLGAVVAYTSAAKRTLLDVPADGARSATEAHAMLLARSVRDRLGADWGLAESGASGPTGNRYGDAAGHCCLAIAGPVERVVTIETGHADRVANMRQFAAAALELLRSCLT